MQKGWLMKSHLQNSDPALRVNVCTLCLGCLTGRPHCSGFSKQVETAQVVPAGVGRDPEGCIVQGEEDKEKQEKAARAGAAGRDFSLCAFLQMICSWVDTRDKEKTTDRMERVTL